MGLFNRAPDPTADITALYSSILGREPDQGGLDYWVGQLNSGVPLDQISASFSASPEGQTYAQNKPLTQEQFAAQNPNSSNPDYD